MEIESLAPLRPARRQLARGSTSPTLMAVLAAVCGVFAITAWLPKHQGSLQIAQKVARPSRPVFGASLKPNVPASFRSVAPLGVSGLKPAQRRRNDAAAGHSARRMSLELLRPKAIETPPKTESAAATAASEESDAGVSCRIDEIEQCSVAELQVLYIDALWNYYHDGKETLSDAEFDRIKSELCWQGSGFPTLRRYEVEFVQATLSYYRGEPIMSDEEYEAVKQRVRESGKRKDVTAMLLYTKGQQDLTPEQFAQVADEMRNLGVDVNVQGKDLMCTLSETTDKLQSDALEIVKMYAALGAVPQAISLASWLLLSLLIGGPGGVADSAATAIPTTGLVSAGVVAVLAKYLGLNEPEFLKGTCPCCETENPAFFNPQTPKQQEVKCSGCSTSMVFDSDAGRIVEAGGFAYLTNGTGAAQELQFNQRDAIRSTTKTLSNMLPSISAPELRKGQGKKLAKGEKEPLASQLTTGIFAWAVLFGYALFGEQFVGRVRGKGIALHSGVINDFCKRFAIPNKMRQKYIQTAKKNGHDLGFLVPGGYFGDGLAGDAAMKWWKSTGW